MIPNCCLVLTAHGSQSEGWTQVCREIEDKVKKSEVSDYYRAVRLCYLEKSPRIYDIVKDLRFGGVKNFIFLPLFVMPSKHSMYDLPTILRHYYDPQLVRELKKGGNTLLDRGLLKVVTPTIGSTDVVEKITFDRLEELSENPSEESALFFGHGSKEFDSLWRMKFDSVSEFIREKGSFKYVDYGFAGAGSKINEKPAEMIVESLETRGKTLVSGVYMGSSLANYFEEYLDKESENGKKIISAMESGDLKISDKALCPDDRIVEAIVEIAMSYLKDLYDE